MKGIVAKGAREVGISPDGQQCRLIFLDQEDEDFFVQLDAAELEAFIPLLAKAAAAAQEDPDAVIALPVVESRVRLGESGDVLITVHTDTGAEFTFTLERRAAAALTEAIGEALQ